VGPLVAERERRVAGEVFFKKGHIVFDWRRTASMIAVVDGGRRGIECWRRGDMRR
jgi:hypothetical protein